MKVTAYKAADGKLFESEEAMFKYNQMLSGERLLEEIFDYDKNSFYIYGSLQVHDVSDLKELVRQHKQAFEYLLEIV